MEKIGVGMAMSRNWYDPPMQILLTLAGGAVVLIIGEYYIATRLGAAYMMLPLIVCYLYYHFVAMSTPPADTKKYLEFKNAKVAAKWGKNKIPMHILVAEFLNDNVAFKGDCYEILANHRQEFIDWRPDFGLISFILAQLIPITSSSFKSIAATAHEIADHYDRGNDFFNAFLGPKMIYTSAFYQGLDQTLEQAQVNKLNMLCEKVHLKEGQTFLDIGCGWGTLVRHAASKFKAKATGVTLSAEGAAWCRAQAKKEGLSEVQCEILNCDYREIPKDRTFDAISAVMPAGIKLLAGFVRSIAPIVNCVIFDSDPVGVHDVSAIEFVQITVSTKISGSEMNANNQGTPKNSCVTHAPSTLKIGTPTNDIHSGNSMCASGSAASAATAAFAGRFRSDLNAFVNNSGFAIRLTSEPTTIIVTPHHNDHWFTISPREIATSFPAGFV